METPSYRTSEPAADATAAPPPGRLFDGLVAALPRAAAPAEAIRVLQQAEEQIRRRDDTFRQLLDALPVAVYTTDAEGRITYCNRAAARLAGREPEIGRDRWCVTFRMFTPDGRPLPHEQCPMAVTLRENRAVRGVEAIGQRPDGSLFPFLPFPTPLRDDSGRLVGAVNMLVDISERRQSEAHQRMLLDELNHRVKNNLQMLHGLLRAAERDSGSPEARLVLADAGRRVAAMAAAQRLLYGEASPAGVEAAAFLQAVSDSARQAFGGDVTVRIEAAPAHLGHDLAVPLALILSELLTNAAKHGLDGGGGTIAVTLARAESDLVLTVADDGPGFAPPAGGRRSSGLGLVAGLARQLRGSFVVEPGAGARCVLRFPAART